MLLSILSEAKCDLVVRQGVFAWTEQALFPHYLQSRQHLKHSVAVQLSAGGADYEGYVCPKGCFLCVFHSFISRLGINELRLKSALGTLEGFHLFEQYMKTKSAKRLLDFAFDWTSLRYCLDIQILSLQ